jgi:hypothetical protein
MASFPFMSSLYPKSLARLSMHSPAILTAEDGLTPSNGDHWDKENAQVLIYPREIRLGRSAGGTPSWIIA